MGKGNTTSTVTQQKFPEEIVPYLTSSLERGEALSLEDYIPYTGERLATPGSDVEASRDVIRDLAAAGTPGKDYAMGEAIRAGQEAGAVGGGPYQFSASEFTQPQQFTSEIAAQYMDPYVQQVLDIQKAKAAEDYAIAQTGRQGEATAAGAFGGSRSAVREALAERDLLNRQTELQATGMQDAYSRARQAFEADRAAQFATEQARAGEAGRVQTGQAAEDQTARQFELTKLGFSSDQAARVAALEDAARAGDIQSAQLLEAIGKSIQSQEQAGLDIAYEDFLRQQNYPKDQLRFLAEMVHGVPLAPAGTTETQTPYNPIQQALGAGLSALSLYKAFS